MKNRLAEHLSPNRKTFCKTCKKDFENSISAIRHVCSVHFREEKLRIRYGNQEKSSEHDISLSSSSEHNYSLSPSTVNSENLEFDMQISDNESNYASQMRRESRKSYVNDQTRREQRDSRRLKKKRDYYMEISNNDSDYEHRNRRQSKSRFDDYDPRYKDDFRRSRNKNRYEEMEIEESFYENDPIERRRLTHETKAPPPISITIGNIGNNSTVGDIYVGLDAKNGSIDIKNASKAEKDTKNAPEVEKRSKTQSKKFQFRENSLQSRKEMKSYDKSTKI